MDIISVALKRHSTKAFDASKKLTPEQAEQIKTLLQYSPSSTNSQPWHFIVASTEEGLPLIHISNIRETYAITRFSCF